MTMGFPKGTLMWFGAYEITFLGSAEKTTCSGSVILLPDGSVFYRDGSHEELCGTHIEEIRMLNVTEGDNEIFWRNSRIR